MYWDDDDVNLVSDTIRSGMNWAVGENISKFEESVASYIGTDYCLMFNSGTSATHAALIAHGIGGGDEVITPSFTFISTANASRVVGAKPVFADIEEKTLGLNPDDVINKITPKTRAIMPVHYGGCPCRIEELREIADDNNIIMIEDAAEAFGAAVGEKKVGTFGDSAMMSFCQNKIITTGEGGAIVTDSRELYEKMKLIRSHGRLETADYFSTTAVMDYVALGYNFRMSNITAALGISQLRKVERIIKMRKIIAGLYTNLLSEKVPEISILAAPDGYMHVHQLFSVRVPDRDGLMQFLTENGIMSKIYFDPVHLTHYYRHELGYQTSLPVTERVAKEIVSLPIYPGMPHEDVYTVVQAIADYYLVN